MNNNRRSMMTVFSDPACPFSHQMRIVMQEKAIDANLEQLTPGEWPEEVAAANPYGSGPTLIERDLVLFDSRVIIDYFDERFPHPPLMPLDPAARAKSRLMLHRIDRDWYSLWNALSDKERGKATKARKIIQEDLTVLSPLFESSPYFMSDEFSMLDVAIAPLLWRLEHYGIELPKVAAPVLKYRERLFSRPAFINALTPTEKALRK